MLSEFVRTLRSGEARAAFVPAVDDAVQQVFDWAARQEPLHRVAASHFSRLPDLRTLIDSLVNDLAEVARGVWPNWYGRDVSQVGDAKADSHQAALQVLQANAPGNLRGKVALSWLEQTAPKCRVGQLPVVTRVARSRQVHQLALAIDPHHLLLLLAMDDQSSSTDCILAFARAAEWLARHTQCPVLVVIPASLRDHPELDSLSHGAFTCRLDAAVSSPARQEEKLRIGPIVGRPHPFSPGEQLLARHVAADPWLGPLFGFNMWVHALSGRRYLADLLWPAGQVVIEVDGYTVHSSVVVFAADRQRDYELLVSGYLVLRLPHDEVMDNVGLALDKIRRVAALRQHLPSLEGIGS
jgi:hypothetical protein